MESTRTYENLDSLSGSLERDDEVSNESFREEFDELAGDASFGRLAVYFYRSCNKVAAQIAQFLL